MKKYIIALVLYLMFCVPNVGFAQTEITPVSLYVNDEKLSADVFINPGTRYEEDLEPFVPIVSIIEKLGLSITEGIDNLPNLSLNIENPINTYTIVCEDNTVIKFTMSEDYFIYFTQSNSHGFGSCMIEDGIAYMPLQKLAVMARAEIMLKGNDIYIYTHDYYDRNIALNDIMGHLIETNVYVNDTKVLTPVYKNRYGFGFGVDSYVLLAPVCEALGAAFDVVDNTIIINLHDEIYSIPLSETLVIDGEIYVVFASIRYAIGGSLREDDNENIYLYSSNFERFDIPSNLEEAYRFLDEMLDEDDIEYLKNLDEDDIIQLHFGFGMWIRDNWLYPTNSKLTRFLLDSGAGFSHPDDMSHFILVGYHHYLNNNEYTIENHKEEQQKENSDALIRQWSLFSVFIFTVAAVRFFFRKLPRPVRFLEKAERFHFTKILFALCILLLVIIRLHDRLNNSWSVITYSVGLVHAIVLSFMFIIAVARFLFVLFSRSDMPVKKKKNIVLQIISILFITMFLLYYIDYISGYKKHIYYNGLTYKHSFYLDIILYTILVIIIIAILKIFSRKLLCPSWISDKIAIFKLFRLLFVLCASTLLMCGFELILFSGRWTYTMQLTYMAIFALVLAFTALFCFVDMTRKQIAVSAVLPTLYYLAYGIESEFFSYGIGYGFFGFPSGDVSLWDYVLSTDYIFFFSSTIGSHLPIFLNIVFALFPFIYVLLARSKEVQPIVQLAEDD